MRHDFNLTPKEAIALQKKLRDEIIIRPLGKEIKTIAGVDISFNRFEKDVYAGIIILSYPDLQIIEHAGIKTRVDFPYIPGLLSFREIPPLLQVWDMLKTKPDLVMVDGHGIAHPRRLGIATHFGLITNTPTIGCAKSLLYGEYHAPGILRGDSTPLLDPKTQDQIGIVLRSKDKVSLLFIAPGHLCNFDDTYRIVMNCLRKHRLPEPTRLAHALVNELRREAGESTLGL
jgi:deoxyribonuclease V